jgi:hypothetical protein
LCQYAQEKGVGDIEILPTIDQQLNYITINFSLKAFHINLHKIKSPFLNNDELIKKSPSIKVPTFITKLFADNENMAFLSLSDRHKLSTLDFDYCENIPDLTTFFSNEAAVELSILSSNKLDSIPRLSFFMLKKKPEHLYFNLPNLQLPDTSTLYTICVAETCFTDCRAIDKSNFEEFKAKQGNKPHLIFKYKELIRSLLQQSDLMPNTHNNEDSKGCEVLDIFTKHFKPEEEELLDLFLDFVATLPDFTKGLEGYDSTNNTENQQEIDVIKSLVNSQKFKYYVISRGMGYYSESSTISPKAVDIQSGNKIGLKK